MDISLSEFGRILRNKNLSITSSYGSGGFCIVLTDVRSGHTYGGYSWDLNEAFQNAVDKHAAAQTVNLSEEPTNPSMRPPK